MALTSSWTDETAASAPSTAVASTVVAVTTGAAAAGAAVVVAFAALGAAAFFVAGAAASTGAAGAATTGAAGAAAFLETVFLAAEAGALIILVAVEEFMAGIRIMWHVIESIFDPTFIFAGYEKFYSNFVIHCADYSRPPKSFILSHCLLFPPCQQNRDVYS
jgi:hypothetical protein